MLRLYERGNDGIRFSRLVLDDVGVAKFSELVLASCVASISFIYFYLTKSGNIFFRALLGKQKIEEEKSMYRKHKNNSLCLFALTDNENLKLPERRLAIISV